MTRQLIRGFFRLACLVWAFFILPVSLSGDETTLNRFLNEAPVGWKAAQNQLADIQFKYTQRRFKSAAEYKKGAAFFIVEGEIHQSKDCYLISFLVPDTPKPNSGYVIGNPFYSAHLSDRGQSTVVSYGIDRLDARNREIPDIPAHSVPLWHRDPKLFPGFKFPCGCLFDCFTNLNGSLESSRLFSLEVVDASSQRDELGREIVSLEVNMLPKNPQTKMVLKLLPENNWSLLEQTLISNLEGSSSGQVVKDSTKCIYLNDFSFPSQIIHEVIFEGSSTITEISYEFLGTSKLDCGKCRLPAFGIVEPDGLVPNSKAGRYLMLLLIISLSAIVFYLIRSVR